MARFTRNCNHNKFLDTNITAKSFAAAAHNQHSFFYIVYKDIGT